MNPVRSDFAMTALMRAKYTQHTEFAAVLLATGDARIVYSASARTTGRAALEASTGSVVF